MAPKLSVLQTVNITPRANFRFEFPDLPEARCAITYDNAVEFKAIDGFEAECPSDRQCHPTR
jgi:hypothetical protein